MKALAQIVIRNSVFGLAAQVAIKILSFIFSVLIVRTLGAESYGQYIGVLAFCALFIFVGDLGLSPYAVRAIARWRDDADGVAQTNALFGNILRLRIALSFLSSVLMISVAWISGRPLAMLGAIALSSLGIIIYSVQGTSEAVLAGYERLDKAAIAKVLNQLAFVLLGAGVLWLGVGYYGLILANLFAALLMAAYCWRALRRLGVSAGGISVRTWPRLLRSSIPFGIIGFTLGLSYKFDTVLLSIFRGDAETGYYNAAYNLVFTSVVLSNVINTALYPSLARQSRNNPPALAGIYGRGLRYLLLASLPIAVGVTILAEQLIVLLYGPAFAPSIPVLRLIIWVVPLMFASEFLGYVVLLNGGESSAAKAVFVSTSINVLCNLAVVPIVGLMGAAVMTVLTEAVLVAQYTRMLWSVLRTVLAPLVRPLLAAAGMGCVTLLLRQSVPLFATIAVSGVIYVCLLVLLGALGSDELRFARSLQERGKATTAP